MTTGYNPYHPVLEETAHPPPRYGTIGETGATVTHPRPNYVYVHTRDGGDDQVNSTGVLIYSGLVAVFCGICSPITLVCSIPAIVLASMSSNGDYEQRQKHCRMSGIFATIALITGLLLTVTATAVFFYYKNHEPQSQQ